MRKLYLLILIELYINIFVHHIRLATNYKCSHKNQEIYHMSRFGNCRHHWPPIVGEERERVLFMILGIRTNLRVL